MATAPQSLETINARASAIRREISRRERISSLIEFTKATKPDYKVNWHHEVVARELDLVFAGVTRYLLVMMPPQNGKSELVSRRFPAYVLGKRPETRIACASYNLELASEMSRDVQSIIDSTEYQELFPGIRLSEPREREVRAAHKFQVVGHRGWYFAVGVGGGLSGRTVDLGIIDDPIKNREEAESKTYRDRVWSWFISTFFTRQFGDDVPIIIALTHWHEDDLAARLMRLSKQEYAKPWKVVQLEAIAENPDRTIDQREIGEPLWPEKYPLSELRARKAVMGKYEWSSLMQQHPTPPGGKLFRRAWFANNFVDAPPIRARRVRGWDTAATSGDGDYTVGVLMSESGGIFYVEHVTRGQWGPAEVDQNIKTQAEIDGKHISIREEREGGASGKAVIEARAKLLAGWDYSGVLTDKNKILRSRPFRAQCEAGNVRIVRGNWNNEYLDELCDFPTGVNDDQVDGSSCSFNAVLLEPEPVEAAGVLW